MKFARPLAATAILMLLLLAATQLASAGVIPVLPSTRISDASADVWQIDKPDVVEANGVLYATWLDRREETYDVYSTVYFAKSTDNGKTWGENVRVGVIPDDDWSNSPTIAVAPDGVIWVAWHVYYNHLSEQLNDVRLARSTDGGATFPDQFRVFDGLNGDTSGWETRLVINPDSGHAHLLTRVRAYDGDEEGFTLLLATSAPPYESWSVTEVTDVPTAGRRHDTTLDDGPWLSMDVRDNVLCVAWEDVRERLSIYGACSTDHGATFGANFRISESDAMVPEIALGVGGELYAIYYYDADNDQNIHLRRSTDRGATWGAERLVSQGDAGEVDAYDIVVDANGQVAIAWTAGTTRNQLYLTSTLDKGQSFATSIVSGADDRPQAVAVTAYGTGTDTRLQVVYTSDDELRSVHALLDGIAPSQPANVRATGEELAIQLNWNAASDASGVQGYKVLRATAEGGPYTEISHRIVEGLGYVDAEVAAGQTRFYRVIAVDSTGNLSEPSPVVSAAARALAAPQQSGWLAWEDGSNLRLRNLASSETETITSASWPHFAANGARLYFRTSSMIASRAVGGGDIANFFEDPKMNTFDIAANESDFVTLIQRQVPSTITGGICYVYEPRYGQPGVQRLVVQYELAESIAISSDAAWMAYVSHGWCHSTATGIYYPEQLCMVNLASTDETCTAHEGLADIDFAPTGRRVAFASDMTGQMELWTAEVQPDGTLAKYMQITRGPAGTASRAPSWSSDGNWIVFQRDMDPSEAGENWQLFSVRADGAAIRALGITGENPAWHGSAGAGVPGITNRVFLPTVGK